MNVLCLVVILVIIIYFIYSKKEGFTNNVVSNRLIPYRRVNEFIDNKRLEKNIRDRCRLEEQDKDITINDTSDGLNIRHYIAIQCLKINPIIYLSKEAFLDGDKEKPFDFIGNHNDYSFSINNYYHQLYSKINWLFFNLNDKLCSDNTEFTVLTLDIIMKGDTLYLQKFSYFNKDSGLEHIYNDLYNNQINNSYIKIYPKQNVYKGF